jgi:cyanobactin maturation PatA/PatG family protease
MITEIGAIPGLQQLWAETLGHPDICVALLDGPVDQTHPCLVSAKLTEVQTITARKANQGSATQHGTHVASIIFGQHNGPVKGIAPHCRGLIVPIFKDGVDGSIAPCSQIDLARAITQAVQAGAQVINISGGEHSFSGTAHPLLTDAIQACNEQGVLIVAAAGNEGCECLHVPGALPAVLAVGAMDAQNQPLGFSNWGQAYRSQGILAPGENILGAVPDGGTSLQSGTSYATAIVSGVAALLLSLQRKLGQKPDPQTVRAALLGSAHACDSSTELDCRPFLVGRLNIAGAYSTIMKENRDMKADRQDTAGDLAMHDVQPVLSATQTGLKVGDIAPDFTVQDHMGRAVRLSDYRDRTVVLWFYPEADTPG